MWERYNQTTHIFEKSVDNGGSWTPLGLSAAIITEGTFPSGRLPANVAYKDVDNNFTVAQSVPQIQFPASPVPSTNVTNLDCYLEGTFTPTIGGSGGQSGQTYTYNTGIYTKVGNKVQLQGAIAMTALGTITGTIRISGLPYVAHGSLGRAILNVGYFTGSAIAIGSMSGYVPQSASYIELTYLPPAGGTGISGLVQASLSNTFTIIFSCSYIAGS